jgi:hypothetical protein
MPHPLLVENFIDSNQNTGLFHITETIVYCRAEQFHRRTEPHVSVNKRWYVISQPAHLTVEYAIILLK